MCGFTGFVGNIDNKEQVLENMMNTIVHRGPDSAGPVSYTHLTLPTMM